MSLIDKAPGHLSRELYLSLSQRTNHQLSMLDGHSQRCIRRKTGFFQPIAFKVLAGAAAVPC